jgi:hypothetical protein
MRTFFAAVLVVAVCTPVAWARQWTDATGKHTLEAELVESEYGTVRLKKRNGQIISLRLDKLSHADQEYVRSKMNEAGSASPSAAAEAADPDSDGDGLSDFQEVHKYRTNPHQEDTAGDGISDGQWQQRREFTYSVRAVIRVMPPYNLNALNDDYQDVRVLSENKQYAELEVVVYPFNSNAETITPNRNWRKDYVDMEPYLAPGITTDWDEPMRNDLLRGLAKDRIYPDKLTDKQVVEQASRWLMNHSKTLNMFCTFYVGFPDGKPAVWPGLEEKFEHSKGDPKWTNQQQFEHGVLGKEMFANRTHGTCTSTAIYETTALRALGIPTRMILCIPLADGSDPAQVEMVDKGLTHHQVHRDAYLGVSAGANSFSAHTFCEVFVGGRWRRLNYTTLGQNVLSQNYLGIMIKVHTFNDLSEANLAATWGTRYAKGLRDSTFRHSNPYRLVKISDHFGKHANVSNPPVETFDHKQITIDSAYWPESKGAPQMVRDIQSAAQPGGRCFWIHCREWLENAGGYLQYQRFMSRADKNFILQAKGRQDVRCRLSLSDVAGGAEKLRELEVVISPAEYAKMVEGMAYTLHPVNAAKGYLWKVRDGLTITCTKRENLRNTPAATTPTGSQQGTWFSAGPAWRELEQVAGSRGFGLNSFNHTASYYKRILQTSEPGSMIVLLFALDHQDRNIPEEYQDLLPMSWDQIEAALDKGETVERAGKARERNIVLLAAPTESQLRELIRKTKLLPPGSRSK